MPLFRVFSREKADLVTDLVADLRDLQGISFQNIFPFAVSSDRHLLVGQILTLW